MATTEERVELIIDAENLTSDELVEASSDLDSLGDAAKRAEKDLQKLKITQSTLSSYQKLSNEVSELRTELAKSEISYEDNVKAIKNNKKASDEDRLALKKSNNALKDQRKDLNSLSKERDKLGKQLKENGLDLRKSATNQELLTSEIKKTTITSNKLNTAYKKQARSLESKIDTERKAIIANKELSDSEKKISEVLNKAADDNLIALNKQIQSSRKKIKSDKEQSIEQTKLVNSLSKYKKGLITLTDAQNKNIITESKLIESEDRLRKTLGLTETQVKVTRRAIRADNKAKREAIAVDEELINAELKRVKAAKEASIAAIRQKQEQERVTRSIENYRIALDRLNIELKEGRISQAQFVQGEKKIRAQSKLTERQIISAQKAVAASNSVIGKGRKNTDILTKATRRLAQAYTLLIVAQKAAQAVSAGVKSFSLLESAITKVEKTTGLAREKVEELAEEIQRLSEDVVPTSANELLKFAEIAGQLGVTGTNNLLLMVSAADALNVSTNLAGDEAVKLLVRILTMSGEGVPAINNLASSVVDLGNNFAVAEDEIVNMTKEILTGTTAMNLGSGAAAAFGATLAELGQPAERSRNAMQELSTAITEASSKGGEQLEKLSELTGMTADAIEKNLKDRPEKVILAFIRGLNRLKDSGELVSDSLEEFGIRSNRAVSVISVLSDNSIRLAEALDLSSDAWEAGNKQIIEASKAYANQESKMSRVINLFETLKSRIGEAYSDETNKAIDAVTIGLKNNSDEVVEFMNRLSDASEGLFEIVVLLDEVGTLFGGTGEIIGGIFASLKKTVNQITVVFRSLIFAAGSVALEIAKLGDSFGLLSDKGRESLNELQETQDRWAAAIKEDLDDISTATKLFSGETTASFEDLKESVERNAKAVDELSEKQKKQLVNILKTTDFNKENNKIIISLTSSIERNVRVLEIQEASQDRINVANSKRVGDNLLNREKQIEQNERFIEVLKIVNGSQEKLITLETKTFEEFKKGNISLEERNDKLKLLKEVQDVLNRQSRISNTLESELNNAYSESSIKIRELVGTISELVNKRDELIRKIKQGIETEQELFDIRTEIKQLDEDIALNKLQLIELQKLENKTLFELVVIQQQHLIVLDDLKTKRDAGIITISEFIKQTDALSFKTKFLEDALKDLNDENEETEKANKKLAESNEKLTKSTEVEVEVVDQLTNSLGELLSSAMDLVIDRSNQYSLATGNLTRQLLGLKKLNISEELDLTSSSAEDVSVEIQELDFKIREVSRSMRSAQNPAIGLSKALLEIESAGLQANRAFLKQLSSAKILQERIQAGAFSVDDISRAVVGLDRKFDLLNGSQLDPLRDAIKNAKREFNDLDDAINDAFNDVDDRLDALLGREEDIVKRKFKRELEELAELLAEAEASKDRALINKINDAIAKLKRAQSIELKDQFGSESVNDITNQTDITNVTNVETPSQTGGSTQTVRIELVLPNGLETQFNVSSNSDADALIAALQNLKEINVGGGG